MSTGGKVHEEVLLGINQLGTEDEEGLGSDVINPTWSAGSVSALGILAKFPADRMDLTEAFGSGNPSL